MELQCHPSQQNLSVLSFATFSVLCHVICRFKIASYQHQVNIHSKPYICTFLPDSTRVFFFFFFFRGLITTLLMELFKKNFQSLQAGRLSWPDADFIWAKMQCKALQRYLERGFRIRPNWLCSQGRNTSPKFDENISHLIKHYHLQAKMHIYIYIWQSLRHTV